MSDNIPELLTPVDFRIVRRPRRKSIAIIIRPDASVEVLTPPGISMARIEMLVSEKQAWIRNKQQQQLAAQDRYQPKAFTTGETFLLLGNELQLELHYGRRDIRVTEQILRVTLPEPGPEAVRRIVERWYRQQALNYIEQRSRELAKLAGRSPASIGVKAYRSRWGSCHSDGRIYLNWRLIMAPASVIDHVIIHELCHLIHANHSRAFWRLVSSIDPNHSEARNWLKEHHAALNL